MRAWAHPCRCSSSRQESGCGSRPSTYPSSPAPSLARTSGCAAPIVHACGVSGYAPAQAAHTRCPLHLRVGGGRGCAGARCGAALGPACLLGLRPRQARPPGSSLRTTGALTQEHGLPTASVCQAVRCWIREYSSWAALSSMTMAYAFASLRPCRAVRCSREYSRASVGLYRKGEGGGAMPAGITD